MGIRCRFQDMCMRQYKPSAPEERSNGRPCMRTLPGIQARNFDGALGSQPSPGVYFYLRGLHWKSNDCTSGCTTMNMQICFSISSRPDGQTGIGNLQEPSL